MQSASTPTISIVVPAYNASATIARAVSSALAQTRPAVEIIVVDDGSTDATAAVVPPRAPVTVIRAAKRRGAAAARNQGILAARGDWIAFLDADDEWKPEKLERQLPMIAPGVSLVFCASNEFAPDGRMLGDTFRGGAVFTGTGAWKELLRRNFVATPTVIAPRALLARRGFDETLTVGEDQDLWIWLALQGALAYVPAPLVNVYGQPASLSGYRSADQSRYVLPMIRGHIARQRHRLTRREVRAILAERHANAGHIALAHGDFWRAGMAFAKAWVSGHRPASLQSLAFVRRQAN